MKHVLMLIIAIAAVCMSARAQTTGIYVEYYDNLAGWIAVPGYPNRNAIPAEPGLPSGSHISLSSVNSGFYRVFAVSPSTTDNRLDHGFWELQRGSHALYRSARG
jgi:hypothetical protein